MSSERARVFVALDLPAAVRAALAEWCSAVVAKIGPSGARWRALEPESLHVTLCFVGWMAASALEDATGAVASVQECPVAALSVGEPLWLPARRPRVMAVRLADESGALRRVQRHLSERLSEHGIYRPEKRPFLPHVSVARVRGISRALAAPPPPPPSLSFAGERVGFYRSHLSTGGARYERLASFALRTG